MDLDTLQCSSSRAPQEAARQFCRQLEACVEDASMDDWIDLYRFLSSDTEVMAALQRALKSLNHSMPVFDLEDSYQRRVRTFLRDLQHLLNAFPEEGSMAFLMQQWSQPTVMQDQGLILQKRAAIKALMEHEAVDWGVLYDFVFSDETSGAIQAALYRLGYGRMNYCDPDTTYEEDVRAYFNALEEICEALFAEE